MSLWLTLTWLLAAALSVSFFAFCRKRMADITHQVAEEFENRIGKILKQERGAGQQLLDAFINFENPAEAIRTYQKVQSEIFNCPQAQPAWNWTIDDLTLWQKQAESSQRANRSRSTVLATIFVILALNIAAATATTIMLSTIEPVISAQAGSANVTSASIGRLPSSVSLPPQLPAASLPPLRTVYPPTSYDDSLDQIAANEPNANSNAVGDVNSPLQGHQ